MSTRSMVVLRGKALSPPIFLYRHMDGYPAIAGLALAEALEVQGRSTPLPYLPGAAAVATKLLALRYDPPSYAPERTKDPIYELADWTPEEQGDLEHVYRVLGAGTPFVRVTHFRRESWQKDSWLEWPSESYDPAEFLAFCQEEERKLEERAKALELARQK